MSLTPGYGETPVPDDELDALLPAVRELLDEPVTKAAVYDLEQAIQEEAAEELLTSVLAGGVILDDLLTDHFARDLHLRLYGDIWTWAGTFRKRELNIGIAPEQIAVELRASIDTIRYRWQHTEDWTPRELGIAVHAETVRIHPFTDGNGRTTRLLADLVFVAAQDTDVPEVYDWQLDKSRYIVLLRQYDRHRDSRELAEFIGTRPLGE
jgi:fido (protein-threonine AMPylation protein)